jgi:CheY-like chemotaxis protein
MKTILVVDDEFDLTSTLRAVLESEGYQVLTCNDSREALGRAHSARPDLVIMDVMMPGLSGFEVLQQLRRSPELDALPVVLMSSVAAGVKREEYRWQTFLSKPFSLDTLLKAVHELVGPPPAGAPEGV